MSDDLRDLENYPPELRPIAEVLLRYEDALSDGYNYYLPDGAFTKLLQEIYNTFIGEIKQDSIQSTSLLPELLL